MWPNPQETADMITYMRKPLMENLIFWVLKLRKSGVFLCNKRQIAVKPTIHRNSAVWKALLAKFQNHCHKCWFWILKIIVFLTDIVCMVILLSKHKATLSNKNLEHISKFEGWGLILVAYKRFVYFY